MKQAYITETRMSWFFFFAFFWAVKGWCNIMNHCGSPGKVSPWGGGEGGGSRGVLMLAASDVLMDAD